MVARIVGSMIVSVAALIVVSLLVSLGVLWWTASVITSSAIGTMCALAAAFTLDALPAAAKRAGERLRDENDLLPNSGRKRRARVGRLAQRFVYPLGGVAVCRGHPVRVAVDVALHLCPGFGGCGTVEKASPECQEEFLEVGCLTQTWSTHRPRAGSLP
jgi:hypothetical protein